MESGAAVLRWLSCLGGCQGSRETAGPIGPTLLHAKESERQLCADTQHMLGCA